MGKVVFTNHTGGDWKFDKNELIAYARTNNLYVGNDKQPYETYYNHKLTKLLQGTMIHPATVPVDDNVNHRYKYEICDIVANAQMYFVKIGSPAEFAYAVDQAMFTLSKIQNGYGKIKLPSEELLEPTEFHLVLVCDKRRAIISEWKDVYSINFLIHLSELKQNLNSMNISLMVDFVYNF